MAVRSIIEKNLSTIILRDWTSKISEKDKEVEESNQFLSLLKLPLEQRRILENDLADVRCGSSVASGYTVSRERE